MENNFASFETIVNDSENGNIQSFSQETVYSNETKKGDKTIKTKSKAFVFVVWNYKKDTRDKIKKFIEARKGSRYVMGYEVGPKSGKKHIQGYCDFQNEIFKDSLDNCLNDKEIFIWSAKAKGNRSQNVNYCGKDKNFITNLNKWELEDDELDLIKEEELYQWQKDIIEIVKEKADKRTIHWFWEPTGGVGKTQFSKYLSHHFGAIPLGGKGNDILHCAAEFKSRIYIYNIARTKESYISYESIEQIKDGYFMSGKYESKPIIRNSPHVIIFANFKPQKDKLSKDRWNIVELPTSPAAS